MAFLIAAALLLAAPLLAQNYGYVTLTMATPPAYVETPKIQLGSGLRALRHHRSARRRGRDLRPSLLDSRVSNATPASTELLSTRHFDYIISPVDKIVPGSMEDTSISLGDYARQLRAESKQPSPNAMAQPAEQ